MTKAVTFLEQGVILNDELDFLVVGNSGRYVGLESFRVVEVVHNPKLQHLPDTPDFVVGMINLRGEAVIALDMECILFGIRSSEDSMENDDYTWILVETKKERVCFRVPGILGLFSISQKVIQRTTEIQFIPETTETNAVSGIALCPLTNPSVDEITILLDLEGLVTLCKEEWPLMVNLGETGFSEFFSLPQPDEKDLDKFELVHETFIERQEAERESPSSEFISEVNVTPTRASLGWNTQDYLIVGRDNKYMGVQSASIVEIIPEPTFQPLLNTPYFVAGVCNIRGEVIIALDMENAIFGDDKNIGDHSGKIGAVVETNGCRTLLLIPEIVGLMTFDDTQITSELPLMSDLQAANCVKGITLSPLGDPDSADIIVLVELENLVSKCSKLWSTYASQNHKENGKTTSLFSLNSYRSGQELSHSENFGNESVFQHLDEVPDAKQTFLVFTIEDESFALDVTEAQEIVPLSDVSPIPSSPKYVAGVSNLRGTVVTVLNLGKIEEITNSLLVNGVQRHIIVSNLDGEATPLGVIVDSIKGIVESNSIIPEKDFTSILESEGLSHFWNGTSISYIDNGTQNSSRLLSLTGNFPNVTEELIKDTSLPQEAEKPIMEKINDVSQNVTIEKPTDLDQIQKETQKQKEEGASSKKKSDKKESQSKKDKTGPTRTVEDLDEESLASKKTNKNQKEISDIPEKKQRKRKGKSRKNEKKEESSESKNNFESLQISDDNILKEPEKSPSKKNGSEKSGNSGEGKQPSENNMSKE